MNCVISKQIAVNANADIQATMLAERIENYASDVITNGYCTIGYDDVDLAFVIEDAIKDGNEQIIEELSRLVTSCSNVKTSTIKELLAPYAEIAVQKALAI